VNPDSGDITTGSIAEHDLPVLVSLLDATLGEGFWSIDLGTPGSHRVALRDGLLVGVASAVLTDDAGVATDLATPIGLIRVAAVDPSARRRGVATRLIGEVCGECVRLGARSLAAFAWVHGDSGIAPLAGVLERTGFVAEQRREHFYAGADTTACPQCGGLPCSCAADLYVKRQTAP
jgi:ribosomal protein S18 acetylase RimI-like enzyme